MSKVLYNKAFANVIKSLCLVLINVIILLKNCFHDLTSKIILSVCLFQLWWGHNWYYFCLLKIRLIFECPLVGGREGGKKINNYFYYKELRSCTSVSLIIHFLYLVCIHNVSVVDALCIKSEVRQMCQQLQEKAKKESRKIGILSFKNVLKN